MPSPIMTKLLALGLTTALGGVGAATMTSSAPSEVAPTSVAVEHELTRTERREARRAILADRPEAGEAPRGVSESMRQALRELAPAHGRNGERGRSGEMREAHAPNRGRSGEMREAHAPSRGRSGEMREAHAPNRGRSAETRGTHGADTERGRSAEMRANHGPRGR